MEFAIRLLCFASVSNSKYSTLLIFLLCPIAEVGTSTITGVLHQDMLLPCRGSYSGTFSLARLVVNWQRSINDHVVHSFFDGADQPKYQELEFKGRTHLFPKELSKGNASLLLKDLRPSDTGNYTCHYILNDEDYNIPHEVQLLVQEERQGEKNPYALLWLLLLAGTIITITIIVIIVFVIYAVARKNRKSHISVGKSSIIAKQQYLRPNGILQESGVHICIKGL